jgi:hypothetical protein
MQKMFGLALIVVGALAIVWGAQHNRMGYHNLAQLAQFGGSFCDFMLSGVSRIKQLAGVRS